MLLAVVLVFGVLVPLYKGMAVLDPRVVAAYGCMALLFVAPASTDWAATRGSQASRKAILGRIGTIVGYGWGVAAIMLISAAVTAILTNSRGGFFRPSLQLYVSVLVFGLAASAAVAILGALLASRLSPPNAKAILRAAFLVVLMAFVFGSRIFPERWQYAIIDRTSTRRAMTHLAWQSAAVATVLAALLLIPLLRKTGPKAPVDEG